jgi:membrane fusion protein (multidrug efflux system)
MRPGPALLALAMAAAACRSAGDASTAQAERAVPVEIALVGTEDVDVTVAAVGTLEAEQSVKVQPKRAGRVVELAMAEGVWVTAGTALARLDARDLRARLDQTRAAETEAEIRVANASRQFERTRQLREQGIAAVQQYDDLKAELDRAAASLEVAHANRAFAEAELAETVILAPFDGVLGRQLVDVGAFVKDGDTLTSIVDADPVEIVFAVPERHAPEIKNGQDVAVAVASYAGRAFPGKVTFIAPEVDPVNRTVIVKAVLPNADLALRPGQFATVALTLAHHADAAVVPEEAIVPSGDQTYVYVVEDGKAHARAVTLGVRLPGRAEVTSGVPAGARVVRLGHEKLRLDLASPVADAATEKKDG